MVDQFWTFRCAYPQSIRFARCFDCKRSNTGFRLDSLEVQIGHNDALPSTIVAVGVLSHVVLSCRCVLKRSRRDRQCLYGEILSDFRLAPKRPAKAAFKHIADPVCLSDFCNQGWKFAHFAQASAGPSIKKSLGLRLIWAPTIACISLSALSWTGIEMLEAINSVTA